MAFVQENGVKMHNKSVMLARKKPRAGTGLRVAPARPIHWR
jgi:hypothetical protein